jgi:hypothetical protein
LLLHLYTKILVHNNEAIQVDDDNRAIMEELIGARLEPLSPEEILAVDEAFSRPKSEEVREIVDLLLLSSYSLCMTRF